MSDDTTDLADYPTSISTSREVCRASGTGGGGLRRLADVVFPIGQRAACGGDGEVERDAGVAQLVRRLPRIGVVDALGGRGGHGVFERVEQRRGCPMDQSGRARREVRGSAQPDTRA